MANELAVISIERIEHSILLVRGHKVVLDADLAFIYGTTTRVLNQAVQRNRLRFPEDFTFQLTLEECSSCLRSQIVISNAPRQAHRLSRGARTAGVPPVSAEFNAEFDAAKKGHPTMKAFLLILLAAAVYTLHQDFWNWSSKGPYVFGFLPIGLAYHAGYSILCAIMMFVFVKFAWPKHLEEIETHSAHSAAEGSAQEKS